MKRISLLFFILILSSFVLISCGSKGCDHVAGEPSYISKGEPTCTEGGAYEEVICCTACGEEISRIEKPLSALGHDYRYGICTVCGGEELADDEVLYIRCNKYESPYIYGSYILFGEYPMTLKWDSVTISETRDERGYYLGSDGEYYAAVTADPLSEEFKFANGDTIEKNTVYYFKVERLRWRIVAERDGCALLICDSIIDSMAYDDEGENNYETSSVRKWLNSSFYETAFGEMQREIIMTTLVNNSVGSTGYRDNPNACGDTEDKIFLPSYEEVTNAEYGFEKSSTAYDEMRMLKTNDYSLAKGAYVSSESRYDDIGWWWLRSASNEDGTCVRFVRFNGRVKNTASSKFTHYGIVPALWIKL